VAPVGADGDAVGISHAGLEHGDLVSPLVKRSGAPPASVASTWRSTWRCCWLRAALVAFGLMERAYPAARFIGGFLQSSSLGIGFCSTPAQNRTRLEFPSAMEQKRTRSFKKPEEIISHFSNYLFEHTAMRSNFWAVCCGMNERAKSGRQ